MVLSLCLNPWPEVRNTGPWTVSGPPKVPLKGRTLKSLKLLGPLRVAVDAAGDESASFPELLAAPSSPKCLCCPT